jgi:hypothetical protein
VTDAKPNHRNGKTDTSEVLGSGLVAQQDTSVAADLGAFGRKRARFEGVFMAGLLRQQ